MEEIELGVSKFNNINGVTCYMNSILSIIQQIPILSNYIVNGYFKDVLISNCNNKDEINDSIIYNLHQVLKASLENDNKNITPSTFRKKISKKDEIWGEHQHQDSQEFLNFLITSMEEEIKQKVDFIPGNIFNITIENKSIEENLDNIFSILQWQKSLKKEFSPLKLLFSGQFLNVIECSICNNKSNNYELFQTLSLPIPIQNKGNDLIKTFTLNDCLSNYFKNEKLDKDNKINCDFCYLKNQSNKYSKLWKTPKILVIHIKRFLVNNYGVMSQKLINKIDFPINDLDISNYIDKNSPDINKSKYNLMGVNYHISLGGMLNCNFGHYISAVKNRFNNKWYLFDDNKVSELNYREDIISNNRNKNAYLLFYYRTN